MLTPSQMSLAILHGDDRIHDALADRFLAGPSKYVFGAFAPAGNCITRVNRDDSVEGGIQDQPRSDLGQTELFLRPFTCCDVRRDVGGRIGLTIPVEDWELLNSAPAWTYIGCSKLLECHHLARPEHFSIVCSERARFAQFR